jgi:hypothetical protein
MASIAVLMRNFPLQTDAEARQGSKAVRDLARLSASRVSFAIWAQLKQGALKGPCVSLSADCQEEISVQPR